MDIANVIESLKGENADSVSSVESEYGSCLHRNSSAISVQDLRGFSHLSNDSRNAY